jgi:DNA-binding transcriptional LysR family regulator
MNVNMPDFLPARICAGACLGGLVHIAFYIVAVGNRIVFAVDRVSDLLAIIKGTYEYLIKLLWSDILLKTKTDFPSLQLQITARSSFVPQSTAVNEFDLIVDVEPVTSKELLSVKLMTDVFAFYCSSHLPAKQSQRIADLDLVYVPSGIDGSRMTLYESLVKFDLSPRSIYEVDTFETCRHLAISQLGVTILPKSVGDQEVKRNTLRPLTSIGIPKSGCGPHTICATFRKSRKDDPKIQLLLKLLQHQTSQIKGP